MDEIDILFDDFPVSASSGNGDPDVILSMQESLSEDVPGCSNSSRYKDESSTNTAATVILSSDSDQSDFEKNEEDDIVILEPDEKDYLANDDDGLMATKQVESEVNPGGQAMLLGTFDEWIKVHNLLRQEMSSFRNRSGNILRYFCSRRHRSPKCIFCVFIVLMPKKQFRVYTVGQHSHILLPLALIRKSENMTLLCTIDSMEEFEVLRRKNGCMVDKAKSKRKLASIKPCYERIAMYSCKYKKMAKFMKQPLAGLCPFRMLPMPDNEQKGKIRVYVEGEHNHELESLSIRSASWERICILNDPSEIERVRIYNRVKFNARSRALNQPTGTAYYVCLKNGKRYGSCPYKMRVIHLADGNYEVQSSRQHNHELGPIHKNAGLKRTSHFGETVTPKIGINKRRRMEKMADLNAVENLQNEAMEPPNDFVTKLGKIVWKYNRSVANETELDNARIELRTVYARTTYAERFRYYTCSRCSMQNELYCPFKMLARPTNDGGFHIYTRNEHSHELKGLEKFNPNRNRTNLGTASEPANLRRLMYPPEMSNKPNAQPTPSCDIDHILLKWNLVAEVESDEHFLRLRLEHGVCINITNKFLNKTTLICSRARRKASREEIVCPYRMLFIPSTNSDGSTYGRGNLFAGEQHQCGFRIGIGMEHDETRSSVSNSQDGKTKRERPKKQQKLNSNSKITSNKRRSRAKRSTSDSDDDVHSDDELDEFDSANSESDSAVSSSSCCDESDEDWAAVRKSSSARSNTGVRASSTSIRPIPYQLRNRALTQRSTFAQNQEDQCDSARKIISPSFSEQHIETENTHNTIQMVSPTSSIWNDVSSQRSIVSNAKIRVLTHSIKKHDMAPICPISPEELIIADTSVIESNNNSAIHSNVGIELDLANSAVKSVDFDQSSSSNENIIEINTSSTSSSPSKASKEVAETETPSFSIEDISLAMQFSVRRDNLSSISSTIPVKPTLRAECRADFAEPLPTVNAPICYVHLIRPRNDFASIDLLIRSPTKLFCMGEVTISMDNDENESLKSVRTTTNTLSLSEPSMAIDVESDENEIDQLVQSSTCSTTNAFDYEHSDNNTIKSSANHNNPNKRIETNKRRVVDFSALGKMLSQMGLMHTQIVNERLPDFGHQQQRNVGFTLAVHVDEQAYQTASKLLLFQKKTENKTVCVTEYRNGKAIVRSKEHWSIPEHDLQNHFMSFVRSRCENFFKRFANDRSIAADFRR